ncbi:MAG: 3-hydroxyacyl-CoA dehydrogenase family protein [Pirellulales bacterium]
MQRETIGLVGLGFLGRGIAACLLAHEQQVVAHVLSNDACTEAEEYIDTAMRELVEYAGFPESVRQSWPERIRFVEGFAEFQNASFVIESVVEDLKIKNEVFDALEAEVAAEVPIASNTSSLSVTLLAERRRHPERFLGMHWAEPAYATRFLELIRGEKTSEAAFERAVALGRCVGKQLSLVQKDVPAFIVNRLGYAMLREALHLLESGVADAATIDRSFRNAVGLWAGFSGPLRWIDLTGGPALYGKTMNNVLPTLSNADSISDAMRQMMDSGDKGVVNGRGFYRYSPEDKQLWEERFRRSVWQAWRWSEELGLGDDV